MSFFSCRLALLALRFLHGVHHGVLVGQAAVVLDDDPGDEECAGEVDVVQLISLFVEVSGLLRLVPLSRCVLVGLLVLVPHPVGGEDENGAEGGPVEEHHDLGEHLGVEDPAESFAERAKSSFARRFMATVATVSGFFLIDRE